MRIEPTMPSRFTVDDLLALAPPPEWRIDAGSPGGWNEVEQALGTALPDDHKLITNIYGSGNFNDLFYLFNPFDSSGESGNLLNQTFRRDCFGLSVLDFYDEIKSISPELCPFPTFPEPGGLLPLGGDTNGGHAFWLMKGMPDDWPLILYPDESRSDRPLRNEPNRPGLVLSLADDTIAIVPQTSLVTESQIPRSRRTVLTMRRRFLIGIGVLALLGGGVGVGMFVQYRLQIGVTARASQPFLDFARGLSGEGGPSGPPPAMEHWRYPGATEQASGRGPSLEVNGQTVSLRRSTWSWRRLTTSKRSLLITAPNLGLEGFTTGSLERR